MIREALISDIEEIGKIGNLLKEDFARVNDLNYRLNLDYVKLFLYEVKGIIVGFIEIENHFEVMDIINIAVLEEYQNCGIATKLLEYVISNTKSNRVLLEVNEENFRAINLYKKNLFREINRRIGYYGKNDAIIMERVV